MYFGEKSFQQSNNCFSSEDLIEHVSKLLKDAKQQERQSILKRSSNYSWLSARSLSEPSVDNDLMDLLPLMRKMSPESCAIIAVTIDNLDDNTSSNKILSTLRKLLVERDNIQTLASNVKRVKEMKHRRLNRVHPELIPPGRQATVSFIIEN